MLFQKKTVITDYRYCSKTVLQLALINLTGNVLYRTRLVVAVMVVMLLLLTTVTYIVSDCSKYEVVSEHWVSFRVVTGRR